MIELADTAARLALSRAAHPQLEATISTVLPSSSAEEMIQASKLKTACAYPGNPDEGTPAPRRTWCSAACPLPAEPHGDPDMLSAGASRSARPAP